MVVYVCVYVHSSPRYKLLLTELLRHTEGTHKDHQPLEKVSRALCMTARVACYMMSRGMLPQALDVISKVATDINQAMKENDRRQVRSCAQCACSAWTPYMMPGRGCYLSHRRCWIFKLNSEAPSSWWLRTASSLDRHVAAVDHV